MGNRSTLLFILFLAALQPLLAQPHFSLKLDRQRQRMPIEVNYGANTIEVCGLQPGTTYSAVAVARVLGDKTPLVLKMADPGLEKEAYRMSRPDRPQHRQFVALEECVTFRLQVGEEGQGGPFPINLSLGCVDCPEATVFLENFLKHVGGAEANLSVTGGTTPANMVNTLIGGNCFQVSNITAQGPAQSRGIFSNGSTNIGISNGIVMCTGNVNSLPGPNNASNTSANTAGFNANSPDDPDLATLSTGNQWDVIKLEFDFTPTAETVTFEYVFGSEEYCEYATSQYNDVFGFFISGPGINGTQNIALLPVSGNPPVSINNVNHQTNTAYYVNNNTFNPCQNVGACCQAECALDGWTTVLTATAQGLIPCSTYHIKLAICDIADGLLFSAVFLKANSFNAGGVVKAVPIYPTGFQHAIEGCSGGYLRFVRGSGSNDDPLEVTFNIGGTATPGVDYETLPTTVTIPAGANYVEIPVNVLIDNIAEGQETIVITLNNPCSCDQIEITFYINDKDPLEVTLSDVTLCGASNTTLTPTFSSPGQPPYTYQWSTGANTPSITVNTPGTNTYTVTVTDLCGDTSTAEATVTLEPRPTANLSGSGVFCVNQTPSVDLSLSFTGIGPWTVEILHNGSSQTYTFSETPTTFTVTEPGTYSLVGVSTSSGCTGTATGTVTLAEVEVTVSLTATNPSCNGANNGSIQASASGGNGPFTYAWEHGFNGANPTNLGPGTYTVTVTNGQNCTKTESVELTDPPLLSASVENTGNIDCNHPTGSAEVTVEGGTPGYTYNWSGGSGGPNPTFTTGGTYTVTVSDANNCTTTASVVITSNLTPPTAVATAPGPLTCNNAEIALNGNGSSAGPEFTYEWSGPGIVCCENTLEPIVNEPGTYVLTVTNSDNGCTATASATVQQNTTPPLVVIAPPQNISCTTPNITLNAGGSSQGSNFVFEWSTAGGNFTGGTNTYTPTVDQAGTYTLVITNTVNGCSAEASVTVSGNTEPPLAVIEPPATVNCYTPEIELDAGGSSQGSNFTYQWSAGNGGNFTGGTSTTNPTVNAGGTYTITVTNTENNCTATASVTVNADLAPPTAVVAPPPILTCAQPEITLNGNGSSTGPQFTYEWTANPGNIVGGENTLNPIVDEAGSYTLVVTNNDNGCTASATVNVNSNQNYPDANAGPDLTLNCTHPSRQLQGSGSSGNGITIQWTANPGNIVGGANTYTPTVNQAGTYILTVTNTNNGCSSTAEVTVSENFDTPTAVIAPPGTVNCYTPEIELDAGGSSQGSEYTFSWTANPGNFTGGTNSPNPTVNQAGTYTLVITNTESGCTATASVMVNADLAPPTAVVGPPPILTCAQPEITLNGNGSSTGPQFTYEWTANPGNIVGGENTLNPIVDEAGSYTLVVTNNDNGCTASATVNVNSNQNYPDANAGPDLTLNCTHPSRQLQGSGSSGNGITIQWTANPGNIVGGANTYTPTVDQAGTYILTVTNTNNGCSSTAEVTVSENFEFPIALINPPGTINCYTPTIELDATGSSQGPEFTFSWSANPGGFSGGTNSPTPTVNQAGTYTVTVTNTENGCTATASTTVTADLTLPTAVVAPPPILTCQNPQITLDGNGSSSGPQFTYEWTANPGNIVSGENTLTPVIDQPGQYTLVVTNQDNGCTRAVTVNVTSNQSFPNANAGPERTLNCINPTLSLQGSGSTGSNFSIQWTANPGNIVSGANTYTPVVNQAGTYILTVTNTTNGCSSTAEVTVNANFDTPVAVIQPPAVINCYNPVVEIDAGASSQGSEYVFNWTANPGNIVSGANTPYPNVNQPGTYFLTITNTESGCTATASVSVSANTTLPIAVVAPPAVLTCQNPQVTLNGNGSSQGGQFIYEWTTPNGNIVSGENTLNPIVDAPGQYTLLVTNTENGCTRSATVNVNSNQSFPAANAGPEFLLNCLAPTLQLQGSGSTGSNILIQWTANPGNIVSGANTYTPTINQPGTYYLVVTNTQNGCSSSDFVNIQANFDQPVAVIAPPGVINCYTPEIELDGSASSTGPDITYTWTTVGGNFVGGQNSTTPIVDKGGTYTLLVNNVASGCSATATVVVSQNLTQPNANAGPTATLSCTVAQLTLQGSGSTGPNFTYEWWTPNGNIIGGGNTLNPVIDAPGQYFLVVTNLVNGCTRQSSVNILADQNAPVAFGGGDRQLTCTQPSIQLNGFGSSTGPNISYQWVANPGNIVSGANTLTPTVNAFGYYTLIVTNTQNGCTDSDEVYVEDNIVYPVAGIFPPQTLNCAFETVELDASGSWGDNLAYTWGPANRIINGQGTPVAEVGLPGVYTLVVTNTANGCSATATVTVDRDVSPPVAVAVPQASITCQNPQTTLDGNGSSSGYPFFYEWTTTNGNIVSGELTLTPVVNQVGTYVLTVYNIENGCTATATVQVVSQQTFPTADAGPAQTLTCGAQQVYLDGTSSSQGSPYSYLWTTANGNIVSGANTLRPLVNAPGTYVLTVINTQSGCTSTASTTVGQDTTLPVANVAPPAELSCSDTTIILDGTASSTGGGFTYQWSTTNGNIVDGINTLTPTVNAPGTYVLLVTNTNNGCTSTAVVTVSADNSLPNANAGPNATLTCKTPQLTLDGSASSQGGELTYEWSGPGIVSGENTLTPLVNAPGTYVLRVVNTANGCSALSSVVVSADQAPPLAIAGPDGVLNCVQPVLTLDASASSSGANFTHEWIAQAGGNIASGANTLTPSVDRPGIYLLLITNSANGCVAGDTVFVSQDTMPPVASAGNSKRITCTTAAVTLDGSGSSGPEFVYLWTTIDGNIAGGANTLTPLVTAAGTYTLQITNRVNGCTATSSVAVTKDDDVPIASAIAPGPLTCTTKQIQLNAGNSTSGPGIQYTWTTTNGNIVEGANTLTPMVNKAGEYTLRVVNTANNCEAQFTLTVAEDLNPPLAHAGDPAVLSCAQPVLTLDGSASSQGSQYTYQWTTATGNILQGAHTLTPQVDRSGIYVLVVTNTQNGCTSSASVQILLDQSSPQAEAGPQQRLTCTSNTVTLNGSASSTGANFLYQWSAASGGNIVSGANTLNPTVDAPGVYVLIVTNPDNGCSSMDSVQVIVDRIPPMAVIATPPTLNCELTQIQLSTAGSSTGSNFTYTWTTAGGGFVSGANTPSPVVNRPGTYNLLIRNLLNGCTATASVSVSQNVLVPVVDAGPNAELNCEVTSLTLNGTVSNLNGSPAQIGWTTPNGNIISGANTLTPTINAPGVYTLVVTNADNRCSATDQVVVTQNTTLPLATAATPPLLTCASPLVQLNGNGSSSGPLFAYRWIALNGGGILSGANTLIPTVNAPGVYRLIVTNTINKCIDSTEVLVLQDITQPVAVAIDSAVLTCASPTLRLDGTGSSTGARYRYDWATLDGQINDGANTLQPTVSAPGTYVLVVTDTENGCTKETSVRVLQDVNAPTALIATPAELTCLIQEVRLDASASSSGARFTYRWTTSDGNITAGETTAQPQVNMPGTYTLRITNTHNGCTAERAVTVTQNIEPPVVAVLPADTITCARSAVRLSAFGSGGGQGVRYEWSTLNGNILSGANTPAPLINSGGHYTLLVTDNSNGCTTTAAVQVPIDTTPPLILLAPPGLLTCAVRQVSLDASLSAQGSAYRYAWSGPGIVAGEQSLIALVNRPGNYSLLIVNEQNGCTASASVSVSEDTQPPVAWAGGDFEITCSVEEGVLNADGSSIGPNITYQWTTSDGNILSGASAPNPLVNAPGTYRLTVTNTLNGCTSTDTAVVTENTDYPVGLRLFVEPPSCDGRKGTIRFEVVQGGVGPYLYSIDGGNTFLTLNQFTQLPPGQYVLVVQDANGCEYEERLTFAVPVEPVVTLGPEIRLEFGESHTLRAQINIPYYEVDTIIWSPMESITPTKRPDVVIVRPFTSTEYTVRVINKEGCEAQARVIVRVGDPNLWAPNAISPTQGEGRNDFFTIFAAPNTVNKINSLQIYDRWGNLVFRQQNIPPNTPKYGWDGRFRGQPMNPAVFVWWAEVELTSGQVILLKGDLTLVD